MMSMKSIYDRQLDTNIFKRLQKTNFTLSTKLANKILGPCSYNPMTIDEIYRKKTCSIYGSYYQQSKRFPSIDYKSKRICHGQMFISGLSNIPDEVQRKNEFNRRYNSVRLDRQNNDRFRKRKQYAFRAPPVTLYEKSNFTDALLRKQTGKYCLSMVCVLFTGIYGPYVQLGEDLQAKSRDWYKGPGGSQFPSTIEYLFSKSNYYKGKFLPLPSIQDKLDNRFKSIPGPTTYFQDGATQRKSLNKNSMIGFLSTTERFSKTKLSNSYIGPASYRPDACRDCAHKGRNKNINTKK